MYDLKEILEQAKQDGQHNLIDIIKVTGLPPYELRKKFGKGLWKSICHNSKYRNKEISRFIKIAINAKTPTNFSFDEISILNNMPTVKINQMIYLYKDSFLLDSTKITEFFSLQCIIEKENRLDARNMILYVNDTIRMAKDLNQPFNPSWSAKRVKKEHDRLSMLGMERSFGSSVDKEIKHAVDFENNLIESINSYDGRNPLYSQICYEDGFIFSPQTPFDYLYGYTSHLKSAKVSDKFKLQAMLFQRMAYKITVLKTPKDYIEESNKMNHCIWSYAKNAQAGRYLAFHVDEYRVRRNNNGTILFDELFSESADKESCGFTLGAKCYDGGLTYWDPAGQFHPDIDIAKPLTLNKIFNYRVEQVYGKNNTPISKSLTLFLEFILSELEHFEGCDNIKRFQAGHTEFQRYFIDMRH